MIQNAEGAYVFEISNTKRAERFLVLGSEKGTYYVNKETLTAKCIESFDNLLKTEKGSKELADLIVKISDGGLAPSNKPCVFAVAYCYLNADKNRKIFEDIVNKVCRYSTDFYSFVDSVLLMNGKKWNRSLRRIVSNWYNKFDANGLAHQFAKYPSRTVREGVIASKWSHKDLLRLSHTMASNEANGDVFKFAVGKIDPEKSNSEFLKAYAKTSKAKKYTSEIGKLISAFKMPHECISNEIKGNKALWESLVPEMNLGALLRNLPKITSLFDGKDNIFNIVAEKLNDEKELAKARIHPIKVLSVINEYKAGTNRNLTWVPNRKIIDSLDDAFYKAFKYVEKTDKDIFVGVDMSGSMTTHMVNHIPNMTCATGAVAMAMSLIHCADNANVYLFDSPSYAGIKPSGFSKKQRIDDACKLVGRGGGTDLSLPVRHALDNNIKTDCFVIFTDNDVNTGVHHYQLLKEYRKKINPMAKAVICSMSGAHYSIADQDDVLSLDISGLDSNTPNIILNFINS